MLGFAIPGQRISYNVPITIASMLIAIAVVGVGLFIVGFGNGGKARLLVGGLIVGTGVATMHYLGMAAMRVSAGGMSGMSGASSDSFLLPLVLGITLVSFVLALTISLSPTEAEIRDDAEFRTHLETLQRRAS